MGPDNADVDINMTYNAYVDINMTDDAADLQRDGSQSPLPKHHQSTPNHARRAQGKLAWTFFNAGAFLQLTASLTPWSIQNKDERKSAGAIHRLVQSQSLFLYNWLSAILLLPSVRYNAERLASREAPVEFKVLFVCAGDADHRGWREERPGEPG